MLHLTNTSLPEWERYVGENSPEWIEVLEDAATGEEVVGFIKKLHGVKLEL